MDLSIVADKAIVNKGDTSRIKKAMKKAINKENITVAFIGGSITMGSLSSRPETCYAYLVYEWWKNKFKDSNVTYLNAGIGATTSQFGVVRVESDLLKYEPDFVITEFSVNDSENDLFKETYEGLIRKILLSKSKPAVMILNNVRYDDGLNAGKIHNEIGMAYHLPIVSIKNSIYPEIEGGRICRKDITPDNLHPNDAGHRIVSKVVIHCLEKIYNELCDDSKEAVMDEHEIRNNSITQNRYFDSIRYNNKNCTPKLHGFLLDTTKQNSITEVFTNGWSGKKVGDSIEFNINAGMISIQYKKTIKRKAPIAVAIIDADEENAIRLDSNFEETWGDCIYLQDLLVAGEIKAHTLLIRVIEVDEDSDLDFYLISVIAANR